MRFSKVDLRHVRMALARAIEWESSLADAHRTMYLKRGGRFVKIVPPGDRPYVAVCKRREAAFKKLLAKLQHHDIGERSE